MLNITAYRLEIVQRCDWSVNILKNIIPYFSLYVKIWHLRVTLHVSDQYDKY